MTQPQRLTHDDLDRIVVHNVDEFGWHCVNVIEDDGHASPSAGLLPRPCVRPAPAAQRRDSGPPQGLRPLARSMG
jgi:hypothetical protein